MMNTFQNVIDNQTIQVFRDFLNLPDSYVDDRGDIYNKLMTPDIPGWPLKELTKILDQVMPGPYIIENADFVRTKYLTRLHTDTADGDQDRLFKNVIIPIEVSRHASTAVFENRWTGPASRFTKIKIPQYEYQIADINDIIVYIEDIRLLHAVMVESTTDTVDYLGNRFLNQADWLGDLVAKRHNVEPRINDYSSITNLTDKPFPEDFHQKYLSHIPIENLQGLTVPHIMEWKIGDVLTFDRQYIHAGTSCGEIKSFIGVFTFHA